MRRFACIAVVLAAIALLSGTPVASEPRLKAVGCDASYCVALPLVSKPLPLYFVREPYISLGDTVLVEGELIGAEAAPLYDVLLEVELFDAGGALVQTTPITPALAMTTSASSNPIYAEIANCCQATTAQLRIRSWQGSSQQQYVNLPVETRMWTSLGFAVAVHNPTSAPVYNLKVFARNTFIRLYAYQIDVLGPGETAVYENLDAPDPFGFYFRAWAQGQLSPP